MRRFVFACLIAACAALAPTWASAGDQEIAQHIVEKLSAAQQQGQLKNFDLDLHVDKGTVWLKGYVANDAQKQFVLDVAKTGQSLGLKQIVDDIAVRQAAVSRETQVEKPAAEPVAAASSRRTNQPVATPVQDEQVQRVQHQQALAAQQTAARQPAARQPVAQQPLAQQPLAQRPAPQRAMIPQRGVPRQARAAQPRSSRPLAVAPAAYRQAPAAAMQQPAAPGYMPASNARPAGTYYDQPSVPGYSWPSYAAHPNYSAVTYPKQYSPTAWPYIGPFYPYPQVPLGWRKVTMEWDDGWWYLDFHDR